MPEDAGKKIKRVVIYNNSNCHIHGFEFFNKNNNLLLKVGASPTKDKEIILEDDERIIGFKAKLYGGHQSVYSDF
jgi:hypothetical protein